MATVLYGLNLGQAQQNMLTTNPGPGTTSRQIEIQIDKTVFTNTADIQTYLELMIDQIVAKWKPS